MYWKWIKAKLKFELQKIEHNIYWLALVINSIRAREHKRLYATCLITSLAGFGIYSQFFFNIDLRRHPCCQSRWTPGDWQLELCQSLRHPGNFVANFPCPPAQRSCKDNLYSQTTSRILYNPPQPRKFTIVFCLLSNFFFFTLDYFKGCV